MAAPKGHARYGGRRKGVPNKVTMQVREAIGQVAEACAPRIQEWLDAIDDSAKRMDLYLKMLEYHVPKLGRVELTGADGGPLEVKVVRFSDPSKPVASPAVPVEGVERAGTGVPPRRPVPPPKGG